ncbi:MAG TPA: hypothetical protein VFG50_00585 [Rhodothermales bacterium]|nr:hypothetical protein [Rhodothermales bacterium]
MTTPSLPDLRAQLDSIDACLRKYVRMRALLIEVIAFMEDENEQQHLKLITERSKFQAPPPAPQGEREESFRPGPDQFRPKPSLPVEDAPGRRSSMIANTLSMEA